MKREPSTASRALRAVSLVITLVSIVTFSTMGYSAFADLRGVISTLGSGGQGAASNLLVNGNSAELDFAYNVQNGGLYPLLISISCQPDASLSVSCSGGNVTIPAGATQQVRFAVSVADLTKLEGAIAAGQQVRLNGTAQISLEPFATLSAVFDLGSILSGAIH